VPLTTREVRPMLLLGNIDRRAGRAVHLSLADYAALER
jgi:hypothetical protein